MLRLLSIVAAIAIAVPACSGPAPEQPASSVAAGQPAPQGQSPAPVSQDSAGAPPSSPPAPAATPKTAPWRACEPAACTRHRRRPSRGSLA